MSINIVVKTDSFRLHTPGTGEDFQGSNPQSSSARPQVANMGSLSIKDLSD
jgi:hypothetical protein